MMPAELKADMAGKHQGVYAVGGPPTPNRPSPRRLCGPALLGRYPTKALFGAVPPARHATLYGCDAQSWAAIRSALRKGDSRDGVVTLVVERPAAAGSEARRQQQQQQQQERDAPPQPLG